MMIRHVPNILTFGRLVLSVVFLAMIFFEPSLPADRDMSFPGYLDAAFIIFVIAGLTDMVDGAMARKLNVTSKFGRIVDPLADKVLICGSFIVFALIGQPRLFDFSDTQHLIIQWGFAGIIIAREAFVTILRHYSEAKGIKFPATFSGKIKMFLQAFAVGTVVVKMAHVQTDLWGYWFTSAVYLATVTITVVSGFLSIRKAKPAIQL
ncbi:MAG: CDP-alcohol phosphatidyltransferase family protein [Sedimentisphaerales bacterium]|nr:CDP-alcohol phosphatidyltransferase family protein [Sedimentisphaerales bacterium]